MEDKASSNKVWNSSYVLRVERAVDKPEETFKEQTGHFSLSVFVFLLAIFEFSCVDGKYSFTRMEEFIAPQKIYL